MKNRMMIFVMMLVPTLVFAQAPEGKPKRDGDFHKKMSEMRVKYVKENLGLTDAQNEKFEVAYRSYLEDVAKLRKEQKEIRKDLKLNFEMKTDAEIDAMFKKKFELEQKALELEKQTFEAYKKIIPSKKIAKLELVERDFRETVLRRAAKGSPKAPGAPNGPQHPRTAPDAPKADPSGK